VRDVLNSLFFVSMGMLLDVAPWRDHPLRTAGLLAAVLVVKGTVAGAVGVTGAGRRGLFMAGLGLAQIGELSFVLAEDAARRGILDAPGFGLFVSIAVPSMILTPPLLALGRRWSGRGPQPAAPDQGVARLVDHVIIAGFGINGRNVSHALRLLDVPHVVVDLNPHTVAEVQAQGGHALYGDARHAGVLDAAGIVHARALVAAIPDAASTREVVATAHKRHPALTILARTRYLREVEPLHGLGASEVIPEELETSIELTGRVLEIYGASRAVVEREKSALRAGHYGALRRRDPEPRHASVRDLLEHSDLAEILVSRGSPGTGCSLRDLGLRERTGASVVAIRRADQLIVNPDPDAWIADGDVLVVFADARQAASATRLLAGAPREP
jgi:CPA2 family monovalent cation:H+ antiporter-2